MRHRQAVLQKKVAGKIKFVKNAQNPAADFVRFLPVS